MLIVGGGLAAAAIAVFLLWRLIARVRALSAIVVELMTLMVPASSTLLNFDNLIGKRCSRSLSGYGNC